MRKAQLSEIAIINPTISTTFAPDQLCTFVPMEAVDETLATITKRYQRPYRQVANGFTRFAEHDVIVAKITPCMENGKCAMARSLRHGIGFGSTEFHVLRATAETLPQWLLYYWRRPETRWEAERQMTGTAGQKRVPSDVLEHLEIPVPSLTDQAAHVEILDRVDRLRHLRRYQLDLGTLLVNAIFVAFFGDPRTNLQGFPTHKLGELLAAAPKLGTTRPCSKSGTVRCVRVGEIGGDAIQLDKCGLVSMPADEVKAVEVQAGDILLARAIGSREHLGKLSISRAVREPLVFDSHVMRLRADRRKVLPEYLAALLRSMEGRELFLRQARRTSVQFNISGEQMSDLRIPLPLMGLQLRFVSTIDRFDRARALQLEALREADHLFESLLHNAFASP